MTHCTFYLNGLVTSNLSCNIGFFTAFSGDGKHRNKPGSQAIAGAGPIPLGSFYIVDRPTGGRLGPVRDWLTGRDEWFGLYCKDGSIDDATYVQGVRRGEFRLHPLGPSRSSKGCIVLQHEKQFEQLRDHLLKQPTRLVPGTTLRNYGTVDVVETPLWDRLEPPHLRSNLHA